MAEKGKNIFVKVIDSLAFAGAGVAGIALLVCSAIMCYEVIIRYFFNQPTNWTLDLSIYCTIWFAFASAAYVQMEGRHVIVDIVVIRFSPRARAIYDIVVTVLFLLFSFVLFYYGMEAAFESFRSHEYSREMWRIVIWPIKAAVPVGCFILILVLIKQLIGGVHRCFTQTYDLAQEVGIFSKPAILVSVFIGSIVASVLLLYVEPISGISVLLCVLLFGGVPIFPALGLVGVTGLLIHAGGFPALSASLARISIGALDNFALVALPLYILVGQVIQSGGVGEELYKAAGKLVGHLPGGEAVATIFACSVFAAISSSSVATAVTIGLVALPALALRKYNKPFSYGLLAAGGTLGIMIPPSGTMIIYSAVTEESLGKLFLSGVIPGLILAASFIVWSMFRCWRTGEYEKQPKASWKERFDALKVAIWGLLAPVIILGGIYSGICTAIESGAIAVAYAFIMVISRKKVGVRDIPKVLAHSAHGATMVMCIVVAAIILGNFMTLQQIPDRALQWVLNMNLSRWGVMFAIIMFLTVLGMFLEVISIMLITLPVIYPIIIKLGFDGIWFAVVVTLVMEMALLTPPVGLNLYVITGIARAPLADVLKGTIPFFIAMCICLVIFCLFPGLSTWLPRMMIGR